MRSGRSLLASNSQRLEPLEKLNFSLSRGFSMGFCRKLQHYSIRCECMIVPLTITELLAVYSPATVC
jgi:hypothetical protein